MAYILIASLMLSFLAGFELGRLYRRLLNYLVSIRTLLKNSPAVMQQAADRAPGVVVSSRNASRSEPIDLSNDSGGVMPMSPRGVALENAKRDRGEL